jgi:ribonuclease III
VAFTHASWVEQRESSYERLEFLGDSVLGLAIAQHLYQRFPGHSEGELAKVRAQVVSRASCAVVARKAGFDRDLAREGERRGVDEIDALISSQSVVGATLEAVIGAVFVEFGFSPTAEAVALLFADQIDYVLDQHVDHKTVLQEELARRGVAVTYAVTETSGPPHQRLFTTVATVEGLELGKGSGSSKKASEQAAAREALANIEQIPA